MGGFNSSNTTHLLEMAITKDIVSYHIDTAERIQSGNRLQHRPLHQDLAITENWLPLGPIVVGITAGASTPNRVVEEVIERIFMAKNTEH